MGGDAPADERLRILLSVHHRLDRGTGAPGATLALAEALERRGHRVEVVGLGLLGRSTGSTLDAARFPWAVARLVRRRLAQGDLDVVDASSGDLGHLGVREVRASSTAIFTRSHGLEQLADAARRAGADQGDLELRWRYSLYHGGLRLREVARSFRVADGALLLNDAEVRYAESVLGIAPERIWRTAMPLDPAFRPLPRDPIGDLLVLGPASWRKGGDVAVRVLEDVLRAGPTLSASWAGLDDPEATARQVGGDVRSRIAFTGRYDAIDEARLLSSHRVLLYASRFEGLPMTLVEALSAGICVVGSDIPGVRDLLADGAGVLVPEGHAEGFSAAVRELLADDGARAAHGACAARVVAAHSSIATIDALEAAYRTMRNVKQPVG